MKTSFICLVACTVLFFSCNKHEEYSLAEQEAIKYCKCASPVADATYKLMAARSNTYNAQKVNQLSQSRFELTAKMNACISDTRFLRYKDREIAKMNSKEIQSYVDERIVAVMKHCPSVAQTLNFAN